MAKRIVQIGLPIVRWRDCPAVSGWASANARMPIRGRTGDERRCWVTEAEIGWMLFKDAGGVRGQETQATVGANQEKHSPCTAPCRR